MFVAHLICCIQDTLTSRANGLAAALISAFRPSGRLCKGILHTILFPLNKFYGCFVYNSIDYISYLYIFFITVVIDRQCLRGVNI